MCPQLLRLLFLGKMCCQFPLLHLPEVNQTWAWEGEPQRICTTLLSMSSERFCSVRECLVGGDASCPAAMSSWWLSPASSGSRCLSVAWETWIMIQTLPLFFGIILSATSRRTRGFVLCTCKHLKKYANISRRQYYGHSHVLTKVGTEQCSSRHACIAGGKCS